MSEPEAAASTVTLGPFRVDAAGGLEPIEPGAAPRFSFRWRERTVHAELASTGPTERQLNLRTRLARVPSSARPIEAARRRPSFALLRALHAALPADWRVGLAPDHGMLLDASYPVKAPVTATGLVTEVTNFLLALAPYLDVLDEAGLSAPACGTENT